MSNTYSYTISKILDKYCDITLVGDLLANVSHGMKNTTQSRYNYSS